MENFHFLPELRVIDRHGLTDATAARTPVLHSNHTRKIGHDRWPTHEYIKQRGVNIAIYPPANSADYAVKAGPNLWMPSDSVDAQWTAQRFAGRDLQTNKHFSTTHPAPGDQATGTARSPAFTANRQRFLAFLIAGGSGNAVDLRLLADGEEAALWRSFSSTKFPLVVAPLAHVAGSRDFDGFTVHTYQDFAPNRPSSFFDYLEPLDITYDGGISLDAAAFGQGPPQIPLRSPPTLSPQRSLWTVLQWQTEHALDVDFAISLRLYTSDNRLIHQDDQVLWLPLRHWPTSQ